MKSNIIHQLFDLKMAVIGEVLHRVPAPLHNRIIEVQDTIMRGAFAISKEYLEKWAEKSPDGNSEKSLKAISIE